MLPNFIEAYLGLRPWDEHLADPIWYRTILLPHLPIPTTARFKVAGTAAALDPTGKRSVTDGPAELTIQILYPGVGLPSIELLHQRQEMERRLEAAGAGEVEGAESGAGVTTIFLRTDDVRRAVPLVERIARELGLADDTLVEAAPVEGDEEA